MLNEENKNGISYCRTYIRTRNEIEHQQQTNNDIANQQGIHLFAQYQVVGYSGIRGIRPKLKAMVRDIEMKEIEVSHLLIYAFDRVLRDPFQSLPEILEILKYVETVVMVTEQTTYTAKEFRAFIQRTTSPTLLISDLVRN